MTSASQSGPTIRHACIDDTPTILSLICELAEYERLSKDVVATVESLQQHLFGDLRTAEALIAEHEHRPVGFAIFFHNFSTFLGRPGLYLEDLFVKPAFRSQGIGKALLTRLAEIAVERKCGRLEWAVLDWNIPAIGFYQSLGAMPMNEWMVFRLAGPALEKLALGE